MLVIRTVFGILLTSFLLPLSALAQITIVACEPHWAAMAHSIGGDKVQVFSLLDQYTDPHHYQATDKDKKLIAKADLLVCTGAKLEDHWLQDLIVQSGNQKLQDISRTFYAAEHVPLLRNRRSDFSAAAHPLGNPHIHFNPELMVRIGRVFKGKLESIDPDNGQYYKEQLLAFTHYLQIAIQHIRKQNTVQNQKYVSGHNYWPYLALWLNLKFLTNVEAASLEESDEAIAELKEDFSIIAPDLCFYSNPDSGKILDSIVQETGSHCIQLPYSLNNWEADNALVNWYETIFSTIMRSHALTIATR